MYCSGIKKDWVSNKIYLYRSLYLVVSFTIGYCFLLTSCSYIRIDGSVPSDVRKQLCNHFQEQDSCQVAILSIKAANTGLTLTAAHLVIFAELYWNPGVSQIGIFSSKIIWNSTLQVKTLQSSSLLKSTSQNQHLQCLD